MTDNQTKIIAGMEIQEDVLKLRIENNKLLDVINNQDVKIADLEKQIEKIKADLDNAIESAGKWYVGDPVCSMLVDIYNDNFELKE